MELKSSVFKKFDKRNLFLVACADVRERFHLIVLLGVVVVQTMREYTWTQGNSFSLDFYRFFTKYCQVLPIFSYHLVLPGFIGLCRLFFTVFCQV